MNDNLKDIKNRELKQTNAKDENGKVYGNLKGKVGYHEIGSYPIESDKSLNDLIDDLRRSNFDKDKVIEKLTKAVLTNEKRISTLERKLKEYGI